MIKFSVIGTSWITESFSDGAKLVPELEFDGVYSRSSEKGEAFAQKNGAKRVFASFEELLASDTELVYIASPNSCHYEQSRRLLESGKHIICEKPITITAEEFSQLLAIAEEKNLVYIEAIMYMFSPARQMLKEALSKIGSVRSANIDFSQLSSKYPALKRGKLPNIFNPKMKTGALNDLGIYCVYPVVDLFGMPKNIVPSQSFLDTGADACGSALFEYADKLVTLTYSKVGQSRGVSQIFGDEGTIAIGSISKADDIYLYNNSGDETLIVPETEKKYLMGNEARAAAEFILNYEEMSDFRKECADMSRKVLECMEKMRTENV